MKQTFIIIVLSFVATAIYAQQQMVNLRGLVRIVDPVNGSAVPFPKISIDLYNKEKKNGNWQLVASSSTDESGFYYFNNIGLGNYFIQVNKRKNYDIKVTPIDQKKQSFLDLPVLNY